MITQRLAFTINLDYKGKIFSLQIYPKEKNIYDVGKAKYNLRLNKATLCLKFKDVSLTLR